MTVLWCLLLLLPPLQVCYISEDYWRRHGRREGPNPDVKVSLCLAAPTVFGIPRYAETIKVGIWVKPHDVQQPGGETCPVLVMTLCTVGQNFRAAALLFRCCRPTAAVAA